MPNEGQNLFLYLWFCFWFRWMATLLTHYCVNIDWPECRFVRVFRRVVKDAHEKQKKKRDGRTLIDSSAFVSVRMLCVCAEHSDAGRITTHFEGEMRSLSLLITYTVWLIAFWLGRWDGPFALLCAVFAFLTCWGGRVRQRQQSQSFALGINWLWRDFSVFLFCVWAVSNSGSDDVPG